MTEHDLYRALQLINKSGRGDFEGKKEVALIEKAEKKLGLTFPKGYRIFLKELGCGDIIGMEYYGIINDDFENSSVPDAVWLTLEERKSGLPRYLILIGATGDGAYYAIDTSQFSTDEENPVILYEINGNMKKVADDFGSFFLETNANHKPMGSDTNGTDLKGSGGGHNT